MKKRLLYYEIHKYLEHKNALVITGMRQVGKTTIMKQLFEDLEDKAKTWFDFENPLDLKLFEDQDYNNIYKRLDSLTHGNGKRLYVFLDEIQNFPEITKIIKFLIDHYGVKFIVTGSSNFYLKNLFPESLSGRKFLYVLPPLSFKEYLYFKDLINLEEAQIFELEKSLIQTDLILFKKFEVAYEQFLEFGGFPEVVLSPDSQTKIMVLRNIFVSFFEKDIKLISDHTDIRQLRDLILLLVPRVGSMIDISKISAELRIDRPKIYNYLDFLQGTFMIKLLPKFSNSIDRAVAGGKKVYFSDTGLLQIIGKVNEGQLFENSVINQLSNYGELSFYNKRNTSEIDVILNKEIAFEVKLKGSERDLNKLSDISKDINIIKYFVISKGFSDSKGILSSVSF